MDYKLAWDISYVSLCTSEYILYILELSVVGKFALSKSCW